jgi:hypothetical protein
MFIWKWTRVLETLLSSEAKDELQIMISEIQCNDPNCVPIETLVILIGKNSRWSNKILMHLAEVTMDDILEL